MLEITDTAHGGALQNLLVPIGRAEELRQLSRDWPSWDLSDRQVCDLELLLNGGYSPLQGFLCQADYDRVRSEMCLVSGVLWPIPVTLDVTEEMARTLRPDACLALRDSEGVMRAVLHVEDVWRADRAAEAEQVLGTADPEHPGARALVDGHPFAVGGRVEGLAMPSHYDSLDLRLTPAQLRSQFAQMGWRRIVAFQTRNPMHRAHQELTLRAMREADANLLVHPVVGMTKPGDVDHYTRVRCYRGLMASYPARSAMLALLPLAMRLAGPREALWHAIIRRNYGCTHFIVGRDHAGPGRRRDGRPFYGPYDAQALAARYEGELGISIVPFREMVYLAHETRYVTEDEVPPGAEAWSLSGTELRDRLADGRDIPEWFSFPSVVRELRQRHRARREQGFTVFMTGLSGSGKSTIANALLVKLLERGGRMVTLLDGDLVRRHLSSELGFSREHRDLNIRRIGYVASEVTRHGGAAVCAPIAPYDAVRREVRAMVAAAGGFVLVHVATPIEVCEARDRKGLYAKARAGVIKEFTGVSDPYETPEDADIVLDTQDDTPDSAADRILRHLEQEGYLEAAAP
jgi:sulfate adenylyltransferase